MDGESPHPAPNRVKRIGIRSPNVLHDTLARSIGAFWRIRKPCICQVKAFDGIRPLEPQNDVITWGKVRCTWLAADMSGRRQSRSQHTEGMCRCYHPTVSINC